MGKPWADPPVTGSGGCRSDPVPSSGASCAGAPCRRPGSAGCGVIPRLAAWFAADSKVSRRCCRRCRRGHAGAGAAGCRSRPGPRGTTFPVASGHSSGPREPLRTRPEMAGTRNAADGRAGGRGRLQGRSGRGSTERAGGGATGRRSGLLLRIYGRWRDLGEARLGAAPGPGG